ncbi:MAG: right-handed parallel beta-helix repeat-containing protein [Edaphocola sp.]
MKKVSLLLMAVLMMAAAALHAQTTVYVDSAATGSNDGTSWANAYTRLTSAFGAAATNNAVTEIDVAKGTYYHESNNYDSTFLLRQSGGIKIYGGYPTGGGARDYTTNPTVLSGNIGSTSSNSYNSYHVMVIAGVSTSADSIVVDGFTITKGSVPLTSSSTTYVSYNGISLHRYFGAGIALAGVANAGKTAIRNCTISDNVGWAVYDSIASPTVINCTISNNTATGYGYWGYNIGGGMYNLSSSPTVTNCTISHNTGTGMVNYSSSPTITNCAFEGNTATYTYTNGGGMSNYSSSLYITNCTFNGNSAGEGSYEWPGYGGGIYNSSSSLTVTNCTFSGNTAGAVNGSSVGHGIGGGMYNLSSSPTIISSTFTGNSAGNGGGIYNGDISSPKFINCLFSGNNAGSGGGGAIWNASTSSNVTTVANCTFSNNSAYAGGGMRNTSANLLAVVNCIIWNNTTGIVNEGTAPTVSYSLVQDGYTGSGNLNADPLFVNPPYDYTLQSTSPAVDAGYSLAIPAGITTDLAGNARIYGSSVDMGAYEYGSSPTGTLPLPTTNSGMMLYPNPARESVCLYNAPSGSVYKIHTVTGQLVNTGRIRGSGQQISTAALASGMYRITITNGKVQGNLPFVKE